MAEPKEKASAKDPAPDLQQSAAAGGSSAGDTEEWVFTIVSATGEIASP